MVFKTRWVAFFLSLSSVVFIVACGDDGTSEAANEQSGGALSMAKVTGTATYRERIALPPNAVFEAILSDVSLADIPAVELGRTTIEPPQGPPFRFEISYDPSEIDQRHSYAVRTIVTVDGSLRFTTDSAHYVITRDNPDHVDVVMRSVGTQ